MKKIIQRFAAAAVSAALCVSTLPVFPAAVSAAAYPPGTYEVEDFEGVDLWTSLYEVQVPGYSGDGFAYLTSSPIEFEIEVEEEGMYEIDVRAVQRLNKDESRQQTIVINGIKYTYIMPYYEDWTDVKFGVFRLKKGVNEISFVSEYGYAAFDTITIKEAEFPEVTGTDVPVDPKATPEARALLKYLRSVYGNNILAGQQEIYGGGHGVNVNIHYDAATDTCVDDQGNTYSFDPESKDVADDGSTFVWTCYDDNGQAYNYNTQNRNYSYNDYDYECRYLYETTGKYPAIRGFDFNTHNPGFAWEDGVTDRMIDWTTNKNGICTASWHVTVPTSMDDFEIDDEGNITKISNDWQQFTYTEKTDFVTANCMVEGTKEYVFFQEAMRLLATELKKLQDANVPVIFRPLHEAEGNGGADGSGAWFWWAKEGSEVYNQLWKLLYTTLTEEYGIHNLIWEQNLYTWSTESGLWYTGDEWVDLVGYDKYNVQYHRHDGKTSGPNEDAESAIYWSMVDLVGNNKMVSIAENDCLPSIENLQIEQAKWLYFCTWYDGESGAPQFISGSDYQNVDTLINTYQSDYCITLDELPEDLFVWNGEEEPETKPATEETTEETEPVPGTPDYGNVNLDDTVSISDVILLNKYLLGDTTCAEPEGLRNADVDENDLLDANDSLNILKYCVQVITELPVK